jgi:hypothetical protein
VSFLLPRVQFRLMSRSDVSEPVQQNFAASFEGTVNVWLDQTALKTRQWADQALAVDTVS